LDTFYIPSAKIKKEDLNFVSENFHDIYHSRDGAFSEAEAVFVNGSKLRQRWKDLKDDFTIAELGFGFGVSFLTTVEEWIKTNSSEHLNYISFEGFPVTKEDLVEFYKADSIAPKITDAKRTILDKLILNYPYHIKGYHQLDFPEANLSLTLIFDDISCALENSDFKADAWYLDGFAPLKNPEMWSTELFCRIRNKCKPDSTIASYSVARTVRENATEGGFNIKVNPGFESKRNMLYGTVADSDEASLLNEDKKKQRVAIIGGGLAGASLIHSLSKRKFDVTLFEELDALALGASGNSSAVIMPLLSKKVDDLSEFYLSGYLHTLRFLNELNSKIEIKSLNLKGALRLASVNKWKNVISTFKSQGLDKIGSVLNKDEISKDFGIPQENDGINFFSGGSVKPSDVIENIQSLYAKNLKVVLNTKITEVVEVENQCLVKNANGKESFFDIVIIANAYAAANIEISSWIPIEKIKGQLFIAETSKKIDLPICYDGYISPLPGTAKSIIGATYEHNKHEEVTDETAFNDLSRRLQQNTGIEVASTFKESKGKVCFRTTSPDRLPVIGRLNDQDGSEYKNIFVSLGHGSRGMISTFIGAEIISSLITGNISPLPTKIINAVRPIRFTKREKRRLKSLRDIYPASFIWRK